MNNRETVKMILIIGIMFLVLYLLYVGGHLYLPPFVPVVL